MQDIGTEAGKNIDMMYHLTPQITVTPDQTANRHVQAPEILQDRCIIQDSSISLGRDRSLQEVATPPRRGRYNYRC
jgi:hypothetical protein